MSSNESTCSLPTRYETRARPVAVFMICLPAHVYEFLSRATHGEVVYSSRPLFVLARWRTGLAAVEQLNACLCSTRTLTRHDTSRGRKCAVVHVALHIDDENVMIEWR
jgi:hypothetical protein